MKYGLNKKYDNMQTGIFKLEGVIPTTAKNGTTQLILLLLKDENGTSIIMSNFRSIWDAALMNGFDFDKIGTGEDVEIDFVVTVLTIYKSLKTGIIRGCSIKSI